MWKKLNNSVDNNPFMFIIMGVLFAPIWLFIAFLHFIFVDMWKKQF